MDRQLIEKTIKSNNEPCPSFNYENPLLDRNVASALSKSFVKILKISEQNSEPENHRRVDENVTEILTGVYEKNLIDTVSASKDPMKKMLDAFFVRQVFNMGVQTSFKSHFNPETIQALTNINENGGCLEFISKEIIHWSSNTTVLKDIWENFDDSISEATLDDISIKIKPEIEQILLKICVKVLESNNMDLETLFTSEESLIHLVKTSGRSPVCYQMCCSILNYVVKLTNYDQRIRDFIATFVKHVKLNCNFLSFSVLYPMYLSHVVLLLDIAINEFPTPSRDRYIALTTRYLQQINEESETDMILLLTHFPDWFDIFFGKINTLF